MVVLAVLVPVTQVLPMFKAVTEEVFVAPGTTTVEVNEPGQYHLWHNYQIIHEGVNYDQPKHLPDGWAIEITGVDGQALPLNEQGNVSVNVGNRSKVSLGKVSVSSPGRLTIKVTAEAVAPDELVVLSFSRFEMLALIIKVGIGIGVGLLLGLIAIGLIIWGFTKRSRAKKHTPPPLPISN